ncbi:MAG: hypothetical protein VX223_04295, partial [Myxococcota bacterium]|nr:hypothetical protein [Myxococcota bacterium]
IEFELANGDDGNQCKGTNRCSIVMSFSQSRTLEVKAVRDGSPVANLEIGWEVTKNPANSMKLATTTSFSGENGEASNQITQLAQQVAQYEVKASLRNSDAAPLYFDVVVAPKGQVPLVVNYTYTGSRQFQGVETYLFKQSQSQPNTCATMDPNNLPTANLNAPLKNLTQSTAFAQLPGLDSEGTQKYTIVGLGKDQAGPTLTWGCDDQNGTVNNVGSTAVTVPLTNLAPLWKGKYTVTSNFNIVSALPPDVAEIVTIITNLFTDPAGQILSLICESGADVNTLSSVCGYIFSDPDNPCLSEEDGCYDSVGVAIKSLLNQVAFNLLEDNVGADILFTGQDVAAILTDLELTATYEIPEEPKADGLISAGTAEWHSVTYRWTLGSECDPTDESQCKQTINLQAFQGGTVTANWTGAVSYSAADDNLLTIDPHGLDIKYGALLNYLIKNELLPRIAGDGSDGFPKVDTYEELLKSLLAGKQCLVVENDPTKDETCCDSFADSLSGQTEGLTNDVAKTTCDVALPLVAQELEKRLIGLDADTGEAFTLSTKAPCMCFDIDDNMTIDNWGKNDVPCQWKTDVTLGGSQITVDNAFLAVEAL